MAVRGVSLTCSGLCCKGQSSFRGSRLDTGGPPHPARDFFDPGGVATPPPPLATSRAPLSLRRYAARRLPTTTSPCVARRFGSLTHGGLVAPSVAHGCPLASATTRRVGMVLATPHHYHYHYHHMASWHTFC